MKPINLYDIYRKVSKRARIPKSAGTQRLAEAMRLAADRIMDKPTLMMANEFREAEKKWHLCPDVSIKGTLLADQFEAAIRSKYFVSERSWFDPRGRKQQDGLVYCVNSASKPGQLKIGFTTMKLKTRLQKMATRHGIREPRPLFAIGVSCPSEIEALAKKNLRESLVAGRTKGDSVEWYRTTAIEFARAVAATIEESGNSVDEITLFEDCPNAIKVKGALNRLGVSVNRASWL